MQMPTFSSLGFLASFLLTATDMGINFLSFVASNAADIIACIEQCRRSEQRNESVTVTIAMSNASHAISRGASSYDPHVENGQLQLAQHQWVQLKKGAVGALCYLPLGRCSFHPAKGKANLNPPGAGFSMVLPGKVLGA